MRGMPALLLTMCGCNAILGLDHTHLDRDGGPADAPTIDAIAIDGPDARPCTPLGHDEDGDGVDDACDDCPQMADTAQLDSDGDLIGDACDPDPADPHDKLLFFDSFAVPGSWNGLRGTWSRQDDAFAELDLATADALATRPIPDPTVNDLTVDVVFTIDAELDPMAGEMPAYRGIAVWFVADGFAAIGEPSGYLCQIIEDKAPMAGPPTSLAGLYRVDPGGVANTLGTLVIADATEVGVRGRIRVRRRPDDVVSGRDSCHIELKTIRADLPSIDSKLTMGTIGVRSIYSAVHIFSVTAYVKKP